MSSFNKWRNIPETMNMEKLRRANEFEHKMLRLFQGNFLNSFGPLKELFYEGINKKRRAALLLVKSQQSDIEKAFLRWSHWNGIVREGKKCRYVSGFIETLNEIARNNLAPLLDSKDSGLKEYAIERILMNTGNNLRDAFNRWKNFMEVKHIQEQMDGGKKALLLGNLHGFLKNSRSERLKQILHAFAKNGKIGGVQERFLRKML